MGRNVKCDACPRAFALENEVAFFVFVCYDDLNHLLPFSQVTALHHSSCNGHVDVCAFLISAGADVNAKDIKYGAYPTNVFET